MRRTVSIPASQVAVLPKRVAHTTSYTIEPDTFLDEAVQFPTSGHSRFGPSTLLGRPFDFLAELLDILWPVCDVEQDLGKALRNVSWLEFQRICFHH